LGHVPWLVNDPGSMEAVGICLVEVISRRLIFSAAQDDRRVEGWVSGKGKGEILPLNVLLARCFGFPFFFLVQWVSLWRLPGLMYLNIHGFLR